MAGLEVRSLRVLHVGPIDLEVPAGACVCLYGPSGAGKTLLLRACADLDPHEGRVALGGTPQDAVPAPEWRRRVGYLPAESFWWADRIGAHFPGDGVADLLEALGLPEEALGWEVARCSTGERQRLALARLLARRPRALLLDEPTANLDAGATARVEKLIRDYRAQAGAAVLWVTHDEDQRARVGARSVALAGGKVVA